MKGEGAARPRLGTLESGQGRVCGAPGDGTRSRCRWFRAGGPRLELTAPPVPSPHRPGTGPDATFAAPLWLFPQSSSYSAGLIRRGPHS